MKSDFYQVNRTAAIIEVYCQDNDIDEKDYALLIGVRPESLSRIKAGKGVSIETLAKIAELGRISIKDLMNDSPASIKEELFAVGRQNGIPVVI